MRKGFFLRLAGSNIRKHRKIYYPYIITAILTVMMLYMITSLAGNASLKSESLAFTLGLGKWVTTIFTVIFLFYTNSFLMKRRKMEFGLLNILGMEKKHISRVVCYETLIILLLSLMLGVGFGILLDKLLYMLLLRLLGNTASMPAYYVSYPALMFASGIVTGVFALILLNSIRQIHLAKPIELLHGGQVGEKEPKAKWLLAMLGALALGGAYYISLCVTNVVASIFMFFIAVVLVILGTYLLFTAGSVTLLKAMRKNKAYYYKPNHFINVSGMIYRMKQNAVGLANIAILSTMALVIVFSTCSLWLGMQDIIMLRSPNDICILLPNPDQWAAARAVIHQAADAQGASLVNDSDYRFLGFSGYRKGNAYLTDTSSISEEEVVFGDSLTSLFAVCIDDYNRLTGSSETLEPGEILMDLDSGRSEGDTLSIFNIDYHIKGSIHPKAITNDMANAQAYTVHWLVVPDQATLDQWDMWQREAYGKYASSQKYYAGFDLASGDDQAILDLNNAIVAGFETDDIRYTYVDSRPETALMARELYGGLLFIGLFLGLLFTMAMILIVYYKQISEGYDDKERFHIMRKVGLSQQEIKRSINAQVLTVFFLPLITAGCHVIFSFPSIIRMFRGLGMTNVPLMGYCLAGSFLAFAGLYAVVYRITSRTYCRIIS